MSTATLIRPLGAAGVHRRFEELSVGTAWSVPQLRVFQPEDSANTRTTDDPIPWDDHEFQQSPRIALRRVLQAVLRDPSQRAPMTERLFPLLLEGSPARKRLVYETLREFAGPQDVLIHALLSHLRLGDVEPLVIGAGLLEDLGAKSWPVLAAFARTGRAECAYFVSPIAGLRQVGARKRLDILNALARSDDSEIRWRIYEALDGFSAEEAIPVLQTLAGDGTPDDAARSAAEERLGSMSES